MSADARAGGRAPGGDRVHGPAWVLLQLVRNQPVRYLASLTVWLGIWTAPVLVGLLTQRFFDGLEGVPGGWRTGDVAVGLAVWTVGYVAAILTGMRLHGQLMGRVRSGLQRVVLTWLLGLPAARPVRESTGEVVSRFRDDTEHVQDAFDLTVDLLGAVLSATVATVILARVDVVLALAVVAPVGLVVGAVLALGTRIRAYRRAARATTEAVTGFLGEVFGAAVAVEVAGARASVLARFAALNATRRTMMVRDRTLGAATDALVRNISDVALGIVLVLVVGRLGDADGISVGDVALFTQLLGRVTHGAWMAGTFLARLRQAGVSVTRLQDLMDGSTTADLVRHVPVEQQAHVPSAPGPRDRTAASRRDDPAPGATAQGGDPGVPLLEVVGMTCRHPGGGGVDDVDLAVRAGWLVVVTGRVGSGKTTLLRGALGLLPVDAGTVRWRGEELAAPAATLQPPRVAYTPQVPRLFSMDLRDNIAFGHEADDAAVRAAMALATLDVDLAAMPAGLATTVGPRGLQLSGGQVQRTATARMLVRRPELLVFDDLSSALDVETEAALWAQLLDDPDVPTTALVVSNRRPALLRADEVVVLERGRVVARGTAQELLERSATFRELWG